MSWTSSEFSVNHFSSKCDQIRKKLRIRSHLLEKFLMENFIYLLCSDKAEYLLLLPGFFELHVFPIREYVFMYYMGNITCIPHTGLIHMILN